MALRIERFDDDRATKCILHRVADIPGGVTVSTDDLVPGSALLEGTPIAPGDDGMFHVVKTGTIVTVANATAVEYEVSKNTNFKVGDFFGVEEQNGQKIVSIDRSNSSKDVITVDTTLGKAVAVGDAVVEYTGANKTLKYIPTAIAGSNMDVIANDNLFVDAWVIGVVRKSNAPSLTSSMIEALKGIIYV